MKAQLCIIVCKVLALQGSKITCIVSKNLGADVVGLGCSMDIHKWPQVGQKMTFSMASIGSMTLEIVKGTDRVRHVNGMPGLLEYPGEDI